MALTSLSIQSFRNIKGLELDFGSKNVFFGDNGSGKTSILEAVYMLATGRSFRASHLHVIQQGEPALYLRGQIESPLGIPVRVALQKSRNNQHIIKCDGQEVNSITEIAKQLPVQILHLLNYQLLQNSPEARRKQLDWGVFHVKHSFIEQWRAFNQLLKQRNAALRQQQRPLPVWDELLVQSSEKLHELRKEACAAWFPHAQQQITELLELTGITLNYARGWSNDISLKEVFEQNLNRDLSLGYTYYGPQRADLQIKTEGRLAQHVLSQGQQKRLVAALQLSQSAWVYKQTQMQGALLIDDLPAELDKGGQQQILNILAQLEAQIFFTCVDEPTARQFSEALGAKLFHVKHGEAKELN